jgi:putative salt-induced outer membrane protein YdiY
MNTRRLGAALLVGMFGAGTLAAEEKKKDPGFYASGDLTYLRTSGNSEANSFGLKLDLTRLWADRTFRLAGGGLRQASSAGRIAVGTPTDYELEVPEPATTAEDYYLRAAYDRQFSDRFFYTAGAGWERRPFSGIDNRWVGQAGVGYAFAAGEPTDFRTTLGFTYTSEDPIVQEPSADGDFAGLRLGWELKRAISGSARLAHVFLFDQKLGESADRRIDTDVALAVSINKTLALKAGLHVWFDNQPSLEQLPLFLPSGLPAGSTVPVGLKRTDTQATIAVVVNFERKDLVPPAR